VVGKRVWGEEPGIGVGVTRTRGRGVRLKSGRGRGGSLRPEDV